LQRTILAAPAIPDLVMQRVKRLGDVFSDIGSVPPSPVRSFRAYPTVAVAPSLEKTSEEAQQQAGIVSSTGKEPWVQVGGPVSWMRHPSKTLVGPTVDYSSQQLDHATEAMHAATDEASFAVDLGRPDQVECMLRVSEFFSQCGAPMDWYRQPRAH
jgi:hypothetical protein